MSFLRQTALALTLAGALGVLAGCLKAQQTLKIDREGRGKAALSYAVDLAKLRAIGEMMGGMMGGGAGDEGEEEGSGGEVPEAIDEFVNPEHVKAMLAGNPKVRVVSSKSTRDEEKQKVVHTLDLEFDSLKDLYESGVIRWMSVKLEKLPSGAYRFTSALEPPGLGGFGSMIPEGETPEERAAAEEQNQALLAMFQPLVGDLELATNLVLPTGVVETNGVKVSETEVAWKLGFADLMQKEKRTITVTFGGEGLTWPLFAYTAEDLERKRAEAEARAEKEAPAEPTPTDR